MGENYTDISDLFPHGHDDSPYDPHTGLHKDTVDASTLDVDNLPDVFVAIVDHGWGETTFLASRGAEVIRFDGQKMDPVWLDDLEEALTMKQTIQQAAAVARAGDNFASSRDETLEELVLLEQEVDGEIAEIKSWDEVELD